MRILNVGLLTLAFACGAAGAPAPSASPSGPPVTVYRARPEAPAWFDQFAEIHREFINLNDGTQVRYRDSTGVQFDIYIYPIPWPDAVCSLECASDWVDQEATQFGEGAPEQLVRAGYFRTVELAADSGLQFANPNVSAGRHLVFHLADEAGRAGESDYLLAGYGGYRVKLRMTDFEQRQADAPAIFERVLRSLEPAYECAYGLAEPERGPSIATFLKADIDHAVAAVDSVVRRQGWELKFAGGGLWSTVPQFTWPGDSAEEAWHGEVHPGYQALIQLESIGDSLAFSVAAPLVCDIQHYGVIDGKPLAPTLQLLVTGTFALEVSELLDSLVVAR